MSFLANMSRRRKITYGIVLVYLVGLVVLSLVYGVHTHKNNSFNIVAAYQLTTWVHLVGPLDINKGVLYLLITAVLTIGILVWVARRMEMRPNRVQTAVEWGYDLCEAVDQRQHGRADGQEVVSARLRAVRVRPRHQPPRVHPAAGQHRGQDQYRRGAVSRRSRSMPPTPMSRFRWSWRSAYSSRTTSRASAPTGSGGI